ncbi:MULTISPECIES: LexA family protein [Chitinophagaceae]|uniref:LexA family protein n=1 Tax=Chitinophagaceae TaxID=563835 RepID=UPI000DEEBDA9|nr:MULTISPECIES: S24 family peptidase [Chitinophagaceae]RPD43519.1 LexA family transcriptional regulator [Paracnuella aquatica]
MPQTNFFAAPGAAVPPAQHIDLNDQLVKNKAYTFLLRVASNAMQEAGIQKGDVVVVDRVMEPKNGSVVIAALQDELIIRRYECTEGWARLVPASGQLAPITVTPASGCVLWGVVTYVIRSI